MAEASSADGRGVTPLQGALFSGFCLFCLLIPAFLGAIFILGGLASLGAAGLLN